MLVDIAIIVSIYTVVRFVQMLANPNENPTLKIFAALGLLATVFFCWEIVQNGRTWSESMPHF